MKNLWLAIGTFPIALLAFYGWWRFCDDYVDPILKRFVAWPAARFSKPRPRTCNKHDDCDEADRVARAAGKLAPIHCNDECCEECFGY